MRCVRFQDLEDGDEFKLEDFSSVVYVKLDAGKYSPQVCLPREVFQQLYEEASRSPVPVIVWVE